MFLGILESDLYTTREDILEKAIASRIEEALVCYQNRYADWGEQHHRYNIKNRKNSTFEMINYMSEYVTLV